MDLFNVNRFDRFVLLLLLSPPIILSSFAVFINDYKMADKLVRLVVLSIEVSSPPILLKP